MAALAHHRWPGNVRELRNAIEHAVLLADDGVLRPEHLPETVLRGQAQSPGLTPIPRGDSEVEAPPSAGVPPAELRGQLSELERKQIEEAMRAENNNQTRAARRLGISRRSLVGKITKYGLR